MNYLTGASTSITLRLRLKNAPGVLARVTQAVGDVGGNIGAIDIVRVEADTIVRDVTVYTSGQEQVDALAARVGALDGVTLERVLDRTINLHQGGKLEVRSRVRLRSRDQLAMAYTPGVARVCTAIREAPERVYDLTIKGSTIAVVTDGTAVLGLGDIGPEAALPVMEGKAQLFREFGGLNAFPICLATKDVDEIVRIVAALAPTFGGVNLEDIAAPRCFEIERRLKEELDIPVFHDDQHGTAVVTTAALINALEVVGKAPEDLKVVVAGVGAAGTACTDMMLDLGVRNVVGVDSKGALSSRRTDLGPEKEAFRARTNPADEHGSVHDVIAGADVFLGLSAPGLLTSDDVQRMADRPIVFALANPEPEIRPEAAHPHVAVMATGRSDYANQINNVLCFPGLFKGALAARATDINEPMKLAAAHAIAGTIPAEERSAEYIVPSVFDQRVVVAVAEAVRKAAVETGVARRA